MIKIRLARPEELNWIKDLAKAEGWNPGLNDMDAFYAQDPKGFLVAENESEPVGCISCVRYAGGFGFIGFYIVIPVQRGKGFGLMLFRRALEDLKSHRIGLDGVIAQQPNYRKSGFKLAYSNIRFEYQNAAVALSEPRIVPAAAIPWGQVAAYDLLHFGFSRAQFLSHWLTMPYAISRLYLDKGQIKGMGTIRKCAQGYKIGPLFAGDTGIAELLLQALCASVARNSSIYLDVPETNPAAMKLAAKYGMKSVFGTARMYLGQAPELPVERIFGVTTFELG